MVELLARAARPLSQLVAELPAYRLLKRQVPVRAELSAATLEHVRKTLSAEALRVETIDGVKAYFDEGWVLVRPSGTEPLFRVFAESRTGVGVQRLSERGVEIVRQFVQDSARTGA